VLIEKLRNGNNGFFFSHVMKNGVISRSMLNQINSQRDGKVKNDDHNIELVKQAQSLYLFAVITLFYIF
jgi:hypothetical protein